MDGREVEERWAISVLEQNVVLVSPQRAMPIGAKPTEKSVPREEGTSLKPLLDYLLLFIGTGFAVCIVSIERAKNVRFKYWASSLLAFEFLTLSAINLLVAALLIDQLYKVSEPNLLFHLFQVVQRAQGGFALLGFILSVILMKFMSFAKSS